MSRRINAGNFAVLINGVVKKTFWSKSEAIDYGESKKDRLFGYDDLEILDMNSGVIWRI